jgi:aspartate ammonia-lyase
VTALSPMIGYDKASAIAHKANDEGLTLKEAALQSSDIDEERFDEVVDPRTMVGHEVGGSSKSAEVEGPTSVRVFIVMVGLTRMLYA